MRDLECSVHGSGESFNESVNPFDELAHASKPVKRVLA